MNPPNTQTTRQAREELLGAGYEGEFTIDGDGAICCQICGVCQRLGAAQLDEVRSGGYAMVLAVSCTVCSQRGVAIVRAGAGANKGERVLRQALWSQFPSLVST